MSAVPHQLPLSIQLRVDARFDQVVIGDNHLLIQQLQTFAAGQTSELAFYLFGPSGSGCTLLLNAACHVAESEGLGALYLPLSAASTEGMGPELLAGLEHFDLVCLDDLDVVARDARWAQALFHLFNRMRDSGKRLILAAHVAPDQLCCPLPDLLSRLKWGWVCGIQPLDDEDKRRVISQHAARLGLSLQEEVISFLLTRASRNLSELVGCLEELDKASLAAQRRVTIPFVKQVLQWS